MTKSWPCVRKDTPQRTFPSRGVLGLALHAQGYPGQLGAGDAYGTVGSAQAGIRHEAQCIINEMTNWPCARRDALPRINPSRNYRRTGETRSKEAASKQSHTMHKTIGGRRRKPRHAEP